MKIKRLASLFLCIMSVFTCASVAFAHEETSILSQNSNNLIPAECLILSNQSIASAESTENAVPRMGSVREIYTMNVTNLEHGEMVVTNNHANPVTFFVGDFPNGAGQITSRFTSGDVWNDVRVGLCRGTSGGSFEADILVLHPANGSETSYFYTSDMDPDKTYYGFINNHNPIQPISGFATIYSLN